MRTPEGGAPDMKVMGTHIIGKFWFPFPHSGSEAP